MARQKKAGRDIGARWEGSLANHPPHPTIPTHKVGLEAPFSILASSSLGILASIEGRGASGEHNSSQFRALERLLASALELDSSEQSACGLIGIKGRRV